MSTDGDPRTGVTVGNEVEAALNAGEVLRL